MLINTCLSLSAVKSLPFTSQFTPFCVYMPFYSIHSEYFSGIYGNNGSHLHSLQLHPSLEIPCAWMTLFSFKYLGSLLRHLFNNKKSKQRQRISFQLDTERSMRYWHYCCHGFNNFFRFSTKEHIQSATCRGRNNEKSRWDLLCPRTSSYTVLS